jgi:hypothetical protein
VGYARVAPIFKEDARTKARECIWTLGFGQHSTRDCNPLAWFFGRMRMASGQAGEGRGSPSEWTVIEEPATSDFFLHQERIRYPALVIPN